MPDAARPFDATRAMLPDLSGLARGAPRAAPTGAFEVYHADKYAHLYAAQREQKAHCPIKKTPFKEGQLIWRADELSEGGDNRHYDPEAFLAWATEYKVDPYTGRPIPPAAMDQLERGVAEQRAAPQAAGPYGMHSVWARDDAERLKEQLLQFKIERQGITMHPSWAPHNARKMQSDRARAAQRAERAPVRRSTIIQRLPEEGRDDAQPPADAEAARQYWAARDAEVEPRSYGQW